MKQSFFRPVILFVDDIMTVFKKDIITTSKADITSTICEYYKFYINYNSKLVDQDNITPAIFR